MIRVLADYPHERMNKRCRAEMKGYHVVLCDGKSLFMSPAQKSLYESETGNDRLNFLISTPVVEFDGKIERALKRLDENGMVTS